MRYLTTLLLLAALTSCSPSLIYSPSINLTNESLKSGEIDLSGGVELLPETRPDAIRGNQTTLGVSGQLAYGFSDKFNLTVKGWGDIEGRGHDSRMGFSLNGQFIKVFDPASRLIVLPRFGIALDGANIGGYGIGSSVIYQHTINQRFSWYGGTGLVWGFRQLNRAVNRESELKMPMGFGIIANLGLGWQVTDRIHVNGEINPVYQINTFDDNSQFLVAPSVGVGYTINKD